jgi:cation diffusion facilitator CzcD-associated flavoprotein CzcO
MPLAGWYGLAAAKQYRFARPDDSLVVFESASSLGGTWADHRLYPGLKSNNLLGTYEYPDFPMDSATFAVKKGEHITGEAINAYLKAYSKEFGIADLIQLNTKVTAAEHQEGISTGGWVLTIAKENEEDAKVFAHRLILATGLTSEAFLPHFKGEETFGGPVFHGKDFQKHRDTLQTAKSVTVLGGSKFCWDAVYAYVTAGVQVDWVIRCMSSSRPAWKER